MLKGTGVQEELSEFKIIETGFSTPLAIERESGPRTPERRWLLTNSEGRVLLCCCVDRDDTVCLCVPCQDSEVEKWVELGFYRHLTAKRQILFSSWEKFRQFADSVTKFLASGWC